MMPPPGSGRLLVRVQPAPTWRTNADGTVLVVEPHHLLLLFAGIQLRLTDCRCDDCWPVLAVPLVAPAELTAFLLEKRIERVDFMLHRDLGLPLADGTEPSARAAVGGLSRTLAAGGIGARLVEATAPEVGMWMRTTRFQWIEPDHVVVPGLLGQVAPDPWGICTPGISTHVLLVGRREPYGYADDTIEQVAETPSPEEIAAAEGLCNRALDAFEEVHGWSGYVRVGGERPRGEADVRREIEANLNRLTDPRPLAEPERRGILKRVRRLLLALGERGSPHTATRLAERLGSAGSGALADELVANLREFTRASLAPGAASEN